MLRIPVDAQIVTGADVSIYFSLQSLGFKEATIPILKMFVALGFLISKITFSYLTRSRLSLGETVI